MIFKRKGDRPLPDPAKLRRTIITHAIIALSLSALTLIIKAAAPHMTGFISAVYRPFSRALLFVLSWAAAIVPFSVAQIALALVIIALPVTLIRLIVRMMHSPHKWLRFGRYAAGWVLASSVLFTSFYLFWGYNYYAGPVFSEYSPDGVQPDVALLDKLCGYLIDGVNQADALLPRDADGDIIPQTFSSVAATVAQTYTDFSGTAQSKTKWIFAPRMLSGLMTTGVFAPFTAEGNINGDVHISELPYVMAHETSHRYGAADESEANFLAFLSLKDADDPLARYSGYLSSLSYCLNALYSADRELWAAQYARLCGGSRHDLSQQSEYWAQFREKPAAAVSAQVYDGYLKNQGQQSGIYSYSQVVAWLVKWYEHEMLKVI